MGDQTTEQRYAGTNKRMPMNCKQTIVNKDQTDNNTTNHKQTKAQSIKQTNILNYKRTTHIIHYKMYVNET